MNTLWKFDTARFSIVLSVEPEDTDPADSFDFPEDIEAVRNGNVEWFQALVTVYLDGRPIAYDSLGCCSYRTFEEFYTSHRDRDVLNRNSSLMRTERGSNVVICHYFPSMVAEACASARRALANVPYLRGGAHAD